MKKNKLNETESSSKEGLKDNWTRATFIAQEYKVDLFREYAEKEGRTIKWLFDKMLTDFLIEKDLIKETEIEK